MRRHRWVRHRQLPCREGVPRFLQPGPTRRRARVTVTGVAGACLALFFSISATADLCPNPGENFLPNEFFVEAEVTSITAESAATASKLDQRGVRVGMFAFGGFGWDCVPPDLEPGNANLGRYAGLGGFADFLDDTYGVVLDVFFGSLEILVANDLPPGSGSPFDAGGDGYAFLGTNPTTSVNTPPWLEWTDGELVLLDPTGQALSDTALPIGPPDLSLFPVQSFVVRGFDADESGAFSIEVRVDVLRAPEPATAVLLACGLVGLGWITRRGRRG
jgi:hypothetical protein